MIFIGLGGNMPSKVGEPIATLHAALKAMPEYKITVVRLSPLYRTAPVPVSDQPDFINAVAEVKTDLSPAALMKALMEIEKAFGRERSVKNAPRMLDLDVLDYNGLVLQEADLELPHPRLHERAFVLYPLRDLAAEWGHPNGKKMDVLIAALGAQEIQKIS